MSNELLVAGDGAVRTASAGGHGPAVGLGPDKYGAIEVTGRGEA